MVQHGVDSVMVSPGAYHLVLPQCVITQGVCRRGNIVARRGRAWLYFYLVLSVALDILS